MKFPKPKLAVIIVGTVILLIVAGLVLRFHSTNKSASSVPKTATNKPAWPDDLAKNYLFQEFSRQLSSGAQLVSDSTIDLNNLPQGITTPQQTMIKKYRLGKLLIFRVGRASSYYAFQAPILEQENNSTLPSGIFASIDDGNSWHEIISSASLVGHKSGSEMFERLEPSSVFIKDGKLFADFADGWGAEGYLIRLSTSDAKTWNEVGCYSMIPEKYTDPFSLDPSHGCIKTDAVLDNWVSVGQKPSIEVNRARETLLAYLGALNMGWYEEAAALYDGEQLNTLRYWNPVVNPDDRPALFDSTCHHQTICTLPITVTPAKVDLKNRIYDFDVILPLGETAPGLTKKFTYTVKTGLDGRYSVLSLPGYVQ